MKKMNNNTHSYIFTHKETNLDIGLNIDFPKNYKKRNEEIEKIIKLMENSGFILKEKI